MGGSRGRAGRRRCRERVHDQYLEHAGQSAKATVTLAAQP